jgi:ABC-type branched-subunit amino acid transport system substrate-binding protein
VIRRLSGDRGSATTPAIVATFVAGILVGALAVVEVVPADRLPSAVANGDGVSVIGTDPNAPLAPGQTAAPGTNTGNQSGKPGTNQPGTNTSSSSGGSSVVAPSKYECRAGANGGNTDRGVTATSINLPTTIVASGLGSSFLGEMKYGMEAVVEQVNRSGGVCGRKLVITTKDDGWDAARGAQFLGNYMENRNYFGIPVGASSEGLKVVINRGDISRVPFPVIGSDGLAIDQYALPNGQAQPWVWPVATATVSSARIMVNDAYRRGARNFAIVFDNDYNFGVEAAAAFNAEVKRLTGKNVDGYNSQNNCVRRFCGIPAGQNSYGNKPLDVKNAKPDFIGLFMEPETALTWMQDANTPAADDFHTVTYGYGAAQPLFTLQFEKNCGEKCHQMVVWSGFKPNLEKYKNEPAMQAYVRALRSKNPNADPFNQFTQSAYVGMQFLVQALRTVGPELTRARLKAVLDNMTYKDPLTLQGTLTFTPNTRFANITMQGFVMQFQGQAGYWRLGTIAKDPRPGAVT